MRTIILIVVFFSILNLYYFAAVRHSLQCRSDILIDGGKSMSSELHALRFLLREKIASENFINSKVQKNSIVIEGIKEKIIVISQVRLSSQNVFDKSGEIEKSLSAAFLDITNLVGVKILKQKIRCIKPPSWPELLAPTILFSMFLCYILIFTRRKPASE